ncbi:MAG TPA: ABC transporter ATP-binding protein [Casimicrobiaceae bacterium]|nr:ABC transporter ATP-binding protein [Casimicrobiaceae bacterium]
MTTPLLNVRRLCKHFGGLSANEDVSFAVDRGEIVGLIGPNGAGKTTLFNCLAGFYPPSAGSIEFDGETFAQLTPERAAKRGIARTFQIVRTFASMTACENVMVGAMMRNKRVAEARKLATDTLAFVGLTGRATSIAGTMTVAEQRRLEIARALATGPKLLLLDEVMAGLNHTEVREAVNLVLRIRERDIACVIVEHVMEAIMPIAHRIVVLDAGRKIADGPPEAIARDPAVLAAYLGD